MLAHRTATRHGRPVALTGSFDSLFGEFDRLFGLDRYVPGAVSRGSAADTDAHGLIPALDLHETGEALVVSAELPGLTAEDVEITLEDNTLLIKGEKRFEQDAEGEHFLRRERRFGAFSRSIPLHVPVDEEAVAANFDHGILTITLPKTEAARPRKIAITG